MRISYYLYRWTRTVYTHDFFHRDSFIVFLKLARAPDYAEFDWL